MPKNHSTKNVMERKNHNDHQKQVQAGTTPKHKQRESAVFFIALILLQHVDLCMCHHHLLADKRLSLKTVDRTDGIDRIQRRAAHTSGDNNNDSNTESNIAKSYSDRFDANKKRRINGGQPEEIFSMDDRIEANYDEYPMVVPKRAALMLDRLMVALHQALEQERPKKLKDFYAQRNDNSKEENILSSADYDAAKVNANNMYSDDDPTVQMDYDFKDLNSINHVNGQTLMAKSFQRRADAAAGLHFGKNMGNTDGIALLTAAAAGDGDVGGDLSGGESGVGIGRNSIGNSGRMYWRCYFNAVSCF